uniref:hypoxia-inducible factor-proline dioxygenase n=1 Tax=Plectus sambesii TaxID=2011161 RepID=A0A914XNR7_9BILA
MLACSIDHVIYLLLDLSTPAFRRHSVHVPPSYTEVDQLFNRGLFSAGQLMDQKKAGPASSTDIRSDEIYWFDSGDERAISAVTVRLLVSMIDSVIVHFAGRIPPYKISGRSRAMIACYPGNGTRYVKHVDNPIKDGRCITSIYYCNDNWDLAKHGGTLRLYPETSAVPMDVDPQGDRLVFFWSDRRNPHEVLPVYRHRFAITIWYFDESEKTAAMDRLKSEEARASAEGHPPPAIRPKVDATVSTAGADLSKSASDTKLTDTAARVSTTRSGERTPNPRVHGSLPDVPGAYREMHLNRIIAEYPPSSSADSDENQDDNHALPKAPTLDPEYQI